MKIVVFKGGLGNQLFQYAFYKYLSRKDETFYFYNDAWYNVSPVSYTHLTLPTNREV